jgi:tRNA-splicing ligase RtcB
MKNREWEEVDDGMDGEGVRTRRRQEKSRAFGRKASGTLADPAMEAALRADSRVAMWLAGPLDHGSGAALLRLLSLPTLERVAVMPDVHPSADVCVGTVLATSSLVYPQAIGGDIGCGMSAVRLEGIDDVLTDGVREEILGAMSKHVDVIMARGEHKRGRRIAEMPDPEGLGAAHLKTLARRDGSAQLGTLGRGNHFIELQRDETGAHWLMVHSGSRLMGQHVAGFFTRMAQQQGTRAAMVGLDVATEPGEAYMASQQWCVAYAKQNRLALLEAAAGAVGRVVAVRAQWQEVIDVPHNFARRERHDGRELIVHRKGAAPASHGQLGVIPGSAGTFSAHVEGRGEARAMASSSHGAGRVYSRRDAKDQITTRDLTNQMRGVTFDRELTSSLRSEAPAAYRDLRDVLHAQAELVRVVRTLKPLVSFKAGG